MNKLSKSLLLFLFTATFIFGCVLSAAAPGAAMASMTNESSMAAANSDEHATDEGHMTVAMLLPSAPDYFFGFAFAAIFLLVAARRIVQFFFNDATLPIRWLLRTRKEFTALCNRAIFLFRTGILHPKIF